MSTAETAASGGLHPELESLLAFWFLKCAGRRFPSRESLLGEPRWDAHLALFDLLRYGALRIYECRACTEAMAARLGRNVVGLSTDEFAPEIRSELRASFEQAWARKAPHIGEVHLLKGARSVRYSDLVLPLSENGAQIDGMLLGSYAAGEPE